MSPSATPLLSALEPRWVVGGLAFAMGLSVALVAWLLSRAAAAVPRQDRLWLDAPPPAYRIVWWPIQWVAHYLRALLPERQQQACLGQLRLAGLDYALDPAQFMAGRVIWGLLCAGFGGWLAGGFALAPQWPALAGLALGAFLPLAWLRDRIQRRRRQTFKGLPFMLDLITLCVESGLNLNSAIAQAVAKGPAGPLRDEFARLLRDVRAGKARSEALRELASRLDLPAVSNFVTTLIQAEATGMSLGPILRAQAEQRRTERFAQAEKLAMQAPVKLLFPLLFFIFPCVFAILMFPIVMKFIGAGL
ncbi:MAG TPA: type II secretion system F family protein [Thauera sp.]|nr:type II secretion system F family protein [Thauera sp.]HNS93351.1 type II secretion system F family protein [Thauera sp.]HRK10395.1 type II secretion system F family protein [Thauera sp.]